MAFVRSIAEFASGDGTCAVFIQRASVATAVGTVAITLPVSGSFAVPISRGYIRVKTLSIVTGGTVQVSKITATDGTTTVQIYSGDAAAGSANVKLDEMFEFQTDLALTSVTVNVIAATQNSVQDVEIAGLQ